MGRGPFVRIPVCLFDPLAPTPLSTYFSDYVEMFAYRYGVGTLRSVDLVNCHVPGIDTVNATANTTLGYFFSFGKWNVPMSDRNSISVD